MRDLLYSCTCYSEGSWIEYTQGGSNMIFIVMLVRKFSSHIQYAKTVCNNNPLYKLLYQNEQKRTGNFSVQTYSYMNQISE